MGIMAINALNVVKETLQSYWERKTCYNMDEPWGCHANWNKPVTKDK